MTQETLEAAAGVYSGTAYDAKPNPIHIERNEAFKAGAAWQRNRVWHKNTEIPSDKVNRIGIGKPCMVKEGSMVFVSHAYRTTIGKYYFVDYLHTYHQIENVDCWAYLDDLTPISFDEIIEEYKDVSQRLKKGETMKNKQISDGFCLHDLFDLEKHLQKNRKRSSSIKNDIIDDKIMLNLLPWPELEEIGKVYTAGAKKYGPNRWQHLDNGYERYKGAMLRHLTEVEKGNDVDADTGCLHAAQIAWNAIAMLHFKMKEVNKKIK